MHAVEHTTTTGYESITDDALLEMAAKASEQTDGAQWTQGVICLEVQRRASYGSFDIERYAAAARKAKTTLYGYARTVSTYSEAGLCTWVHFCERFPGCGFTVARDVAMKLQDATAAVSYLEERAAKAAHGDERAWIVESIRGDLRNLMTPDAPRKIATLEDVPLAFDVLIDSAQSVVGGVLNATLTTDQYFLCADIDRKARYRIVLYVIGNEAGR